MITALTLTLASIILISIPPDARLWKSEDISRTIRINEENWERLEQLVGQKGTADDKAGQALEPASRSRRTPSRKPTPPHHISEADATTPGNHHPQAEGEAPQRWASTTGPPPVGGVFSPPHRGASTAAAPCGNFSSFIYDGEKKCLFRTHFFVQSVFSRVNKTVVSANSG